jgi:hypothetical protein
VLELIGGLALIAAYFMPWFGNQGLLLSGQFLSEFLGSTSDLRRFLPNASGGAMEVQLLRALVYLFPVAGAATVLLALLGASRFGGRGLDLLLGLVGVVSLLALVLGIAQLPPGSSLESGLWCMGLGGLSILAGLGVDVKNPPSLVGEVARV